MSQGSNSKRDENLVPTQDITDNILSRDAVGNKADTATPTVFSTKSIMAYVKGIITMLTKPAADSTGNTYVSEVVGSKDDAAQQTVGATRSIMAYVKALLTNLTSTRAGYLDKLNVTGNVANQGSVDTVDGYFDVPSADSTANAQERDVVGNKTDAAVVVGGTTKSVVGYVKGIISMLTKPSADGTGNTYVSEVVGSKDDAAQTTVGTTRSLMGYLKGVLNNTNKYWAMQADTTLSQASPVQNTWYDILPAASGVNARVYSVGIRIDTTGETLEVRFIVDGQTWTVSAGVACTAATEYYARRIPAAGASTTGYVGIGSTEVTATLAGFMDGKSIQISVRKTTAAGTGTLRGRVIWAKMV